MRISNVLFVSIAKRNNIDVAIIAIDRKFETPFPKHRCTIRQFNTKFIYTFFTDANHSNKTDLPLWKFESVELRHFHLLW